MKDAHAECLPECRIYFDDTSVLVNELVLDGLGIICEQIASADPSPQPFCSLVEAEPRRNFGVGGKAEPFRH
jgi:hypothetical protein